MDYGVARRVPYPPPRRVSSEYRGASVSLQDGECTTASGPPHGQLLPNRAAGPPGGRRGPGGPSPAQGSSQVAHKRHMPRQPDKFQIPKKEKKALLKHISSESREYEGVISILTAALVDPASAGCFTYSCPRLVHSEQLEKEFVEKRREMKADGRTDMELEETYCFLLSKEAKVPWLCEKGLIVGQNWQSSLGDPNKGVYLCRYSDLIQVQPFHHGASGEIIVFKVMKGKVKSIYEIKSVPDPTPNFDSHLSKSVSKITSVHAYRAFEYTQHYFYEYCLAELKERPRQVCPYAVVSFNYKGKDAPIPSMPLAPVRANSWSGEARKEPAHFTVWSGDLAHDNKILSPISLRSSSLPFLPHKLPDRLKLGCLMRLDKVAKLLPPELFCYKLYGSSKEVVTQGHHCSLLEVVDRSRSASSFGKLLQELEDKRVVLTSTLTERGFLFLLSSAQMATPSERGETWKRCLQALFVFPESRDVDKSASSCASGGVFADGGVAGLKHFIPALHHALIKSHANPSSELSAGVELHAQEYLVAQKDGKVRTHDMGEYDVKADEAAAAYPPHRRHRLNTDGILRTYIHNPARYQLAAEHATKMVERNFTLVEPPGVRPKKGHEAAGSNTRKLQQLMDLVMTCKNNAENEVKREEARGGDAKIPARKRRMEQKAAERALKYLKTSHEPLESDKSPAEGGRAAALPGSLAFTIQSVDLMGVAVRDDGSELAGKLHKLLTGLKQAARATPLTSSSEVSEGPAESSPFDRLAAKMGLPANRDIDLRKQDELEEHTAGSVSSLEGFSPSRESSNHDPREGSIGRRSLDEDIPWRLIPISDLPSEKLARKERNLPQDPRLYFAMATPPDHPPSISPVSSPGASPPPSPPPSLSPERSPTPSPEPSPPSSPARCPSPEPSPPPSPEARRQAPPEARRSPSPAECPSPPPAPPRCQPSPPQEQRSHADHQQQPVVPPSSRECAADALNELSPAPLAPSGMTEERDVEDRRAQDPCTLTSASAAPSALQHGGQTEVEVMEVVDLTVSSEEDECAVSEEDECAVVAVSLPPHSPLRGIDGILDKHLGHFSADLHVLLQEESIKCTLPEAFPYHPSELPGAVPPVVMPFSQYVSLYHPCPQVHGYIGSLQDGISDMLREFERPPPSDEPESSLASTVSAFVSSIRAGTDEDGAERAEAAREKEAGLQTLQFSDPASRPASVEPDAKLQTAPAQSPQSNSVSTSSAPTDAPVPGSELLSLPPAAALSNVIRHLRPEVLSNLCDIIKDVQKSSMVQFYLHAAQQDDQLVKDVKEYLTRQGHMEQDPVSFLKQEVSDRKLLIIIKNVDIAEHIHEIPGLVSLKQHQSVVFLGIDAVDDLRSHAYKQLFACGGCVLSEDLVLNPDLVTAVQLEALMALLEQRNSPENVWRWKIHSKPIRKLKEQARFRRDAAGLLDVILKHKHQKVVEVLPQHHCDNGEEPAPDLHCLIQHQALNTQFRHTVFLRVHSLDFMRFSKSGIITAGVDEMLQSFDALLGHCNDGDKQTVAEDPHTAKGSVVFSDITHTATPSSLDVARKLSDDDPNGGAVEQQAYPPDPNLDHASEQQIQETSLKESDAHHTHRELHMLHMAITQLRAQMHHKKSSDGTASPAAATMAPAANGKTAADSTDDRKEAAPQSSKEADDSVSSSSNGCPVAAGEATRCTASDQDQSPKRDVDLRPHKSPSRAPSTFSQRWRGSNQQCYQYQNPNHQYRNQNHQYQNQQHPQNYNLYSDPHRNPARGYPRQQAGQGFSRGYAACWDRHRGGRGGGFNGM